MIVMPYARRALVALVAALAVTAAAPGAALRDLGAQERPDFRVVVHAANPVSSITRQELADLFLKKKAWPTGQPAAPANRPEGDRLRAAFTRAVHRKPVAAVVSYWNQQVFSGRGIPPVEHESDDDVLAAVRANPNAVGYVTSDAAAARGVKVLTVVEQ